MVEKWADYAIVATKYTQTTNHISEVKIRLDTGATLIKETVQPRSFVVSQIKNGKTFVTATKDSSGKWRKGSTVVIDKNGYIRTTANGKLGDNLGSLPEF